MGLNRNIPNFRRAREYHLYDDRGRRYLDLYQNDGRAIMGHRPGKFSHYLKNSISRGMWADYPGQHNRRLAKLLKEIFPSYNFCTLFRNRERALQALNVSSCMDPLEGVDRILSWRPLLPDHPEGEILFLRLPLPGFLETQIVLSTEAVPEGDEVSPIAEEGLLRLFHEYKNWAAEGKTFEDFSLPGLLEKKGPYLQWMKAPEEFEKIFNNALEKGLLFPPETKYPLLIPAELSDYERKTIRSFLEEIHR